MAFAAMTSGCSSNQAAFNNSVERSQYFATVQEMIAARVPGIEVIRRGVNQYSLRIRGVTTLSGNTEPLVVIDGMQVSEWNSAQALAEIDPKDVAHVEVLKDAGAAMYGMRGSNGVIVIKTKRR